MLRQSPPVPKALCNRWQFWWIWIHAHAFGSPRHMWFPCVTSRFPTVWQEGDRETWVPGRCFWCHNSFSPLGFAVLCCPESQNSQLELRTILTILKWIFNVYIFLFFLLSPTFSEQRERGIVGTTVLEIKARDCTGEVVLVKSGNGQLRRGEIGNRAWEHRYACVCTSTWNA